MSWSTGGACGDPGNLVSNRVKVNRAGGVMTMRIADDGHGA
jgi:hypothetical protein